MTRDWSIWILISKSMNFGRDGPVTQDSGLCLYNSLIWSGRCRHFWTHWRQNSSQSTWFTRHWLWLSALWLPTLTKTHSSCREIWRLSFYCYSWEILSDFLILRTPKSSMKTRNISITSLSTNPLVASSIPITFWFSRKNHSGKSFTLRS